MVVALSQNGLVVGLGFHQPISTQTLKFLMGISRDSRHKRAATGAKRAHYRKKRKFELGRQAANTKIGAKRIHQIRVRGGNVKFRALRLDSGCLI